MQRKFSGIPFLSVSLREATVQLISHAKSKQGVSYHLVNAYSIVSASKNPAYQNLLEFSKTNLADGFPISLLTQFSRSPITQIRGMDFFMEILGMCEAENLSIFFWGSTDQVLNAIRQRAESEFPKLQIAGMYSPPFGDSPSEQDRDSLGLILDARPVASDYNGLVDKLKNTVQICHCFQKKISNRYPLIILITTVFFSSG